MEILQFLNLYRCSLHVFRCTCIAIFTGTFRNAIHAYTIHCQNKIPRLSIAFNIRCVCFSPDGMWINLTSLYQKIPQQLLYHGINQHLLRVLLNF